MPIQLLESGNALPSAPMAYLAIPSLEDASRPVPLATGVKILLINANRCVQ
jgi:hypothetical protein